MAAVFPPQFLKQQFRQPRQRFTSMHSWLAEAELVSRRPGREMSEREVAINAYLDTYARLEKYAWAAAFHEGTYENALSIGNFWMQLKSCTMLVEMSCQIADFMVFRKHEDSLVQAYIRVREMLKECESIEELELKLMLGGMQDVAERIKKDDDLSKQLKEWLDGMVKFPSLQKTAFFRTERFAELWKETIAKNAVTAYSSIAREKKNKIGSCLPE